MQEDIYPDNDLFREEWEAWKRWCSRPLLNQGKILRFTYVLRGTPVIIDVSYYKPYRHALPSLVRRSPEDGGSEIDFRILDVNEVENEALREDISYSEQDDILCEIAERLEPHDYFDEAYADCEAGRA